MGAQWHSEIPISDPTMKSVNKDIYGAFAQYVKKTCTAAPSADSLKRITSYYYDPVSGCYLF